MVRILFWASFKGFWINGVSVKGFELTFLTNAAPNEYYNRSRETHRVLLGFFIIVTFTRCFLVVIYNTRAGLRQITSSVNEARSIVFYNGFRCFSAVGNPTVGLACPDLARYFLLKITRFSSKCYKSLAISEGITFVFCIVFSKCLPCFGLPWRTLVSVIFWIPLQTSFKIIITPKSASIPVNLEP